MIELRPRTDMLETLRQKIQEYASNGLLLGILINPSDQQVELYRADVTIVIFDQPRTIDCSEVLPGFELNLQRIL